MKRPSFQFYPADWRNNAKLRRCSEAARGAWMDILCVLHDMDDYGVCRWPLTDLARAANVSLKLVKELVTKDVLKGADKNADPYVFTPRHAGKDGEPVTLVEHKDGPIWYCSRFVRDEYIRQKRGQGTRFGDEKEPTKVPEDEAPKDAPKVPIGDDLGDGPTSTSPSTSKPNELSNTENIEKTDRQKHVASVLSAIKQFYESHNKSITGLSSTNPKFIAAIDAGASVQEFLDAANIAIQNGKEFAFLVGVVFKRREEVAKIASVQIHQGPLPAATHHQAQMQAAAKSFGFGKQAPQLNGINIIDVEEATDD